MHFSKLKSFLIDTPWWESTETFNSRYNGCSEFLVWLDHYNGQDKLRKCTACANYWIEGLHYNNEHRRSFECYMELLENYFSSLDKDKYKSYTYQ